MPTASSNPLNFKSGTLRPTLRVHNMGNFMSITSEVEVAVLMLATHKKLIRTGGPVGPNLDKYRCTSIPTTKLKLCSSVG